MNLFMTGWKAIHMQILILPLILLEGPLSHHKFRLPLPVTNVCSPTNLNAQLCSMGQHFFPSLLLKKKKVQICMTKFPVSTDSVMLADLFAGNTNSEG